MSSILLLRRCPERASRTLPVPDMRPSPFPDSPHSSKNRGWSSKACVAAPVTGQPAPCLRPSWNDRYRLPVVWRSSFRRRSVPARGRGGCSREERVDVAARCTVLAGFVGRLAYLPAIRSPTLTGHRPKPRPTLGRGRRAHGRRRVGLVRVFHAVTANDFACELVIAVPHKLIVREPLQLVEPLGPDASCLFQRRLAHRRRLRIAE
jgi:hypothetical protein